MVRTRTTKVVAVLAGLVAFGATSAAHAFCGFYVSGADSSLYASATMVVMMREGNTTVLSMQNSYQGPPEDFAMVVPVPVVLDEEDVKTLPREIFDRVDQLAAPRLVEYWEQDPCFQPRVMEMDAMGGAPTRRMRAQAAPAPAQDLGVTIEAEFSVAEYDIVILSARDSSGLDTWLRQEDYNIPRGAEPVLRPYVAAGTKFFVAKVDVERVTFEEGRAVLSPLRFHYDSPQFSLPVRLGLLNSAGQQDLIVHVLARGQRYEVANYPNVTIPTNIRVVDAVRHEYGAWYDLLFRRTVAKNPGAVVTEYSWDATSCDPCPTQPLDHNELMTLGADVLGPQQPDAIAAPQPRGRRIMPPIFRGNSFVLTRLHYRYGPNGLGEDLVFRQADPIVGGRGMPDQEGDMSETVAEGGSINNFQGRYVILHEWEGEVACENPVRGRWGGPPNGGPQGPVAARNAAMTGDVSADRQTEIASLGENVEVDIPVLGITAGHAEERLPTDPGPPGLVVAEADIPGGTTPPAGTVVSDPGPQPSESGCASCDVTGVRDLGAGLLPLGLVVAFLVRRRKT